MFTRCTYKTILALSLVAALGSLVFYFWDEDEGLTVVDGGGLENVSRDHALEAIKGSSFRASFKEWGLPKVRENEEGDWTCDVFTPPTIYLDKVNGVLIARKPFLESASEGKFGVELLEVVQEPYRVQLRGWSQGKSREGDGALLMLACEDMPLMAKVGDFFEKNSITVVSFREVVDERYGMAYQVPEVVVYDHQLQKEIMLTSEVCYQGDWTVCLGAEEHPGKEYRLEASNRSIEISDVHFSVVDVDWNAQEVTVKKNDPVFGRPETKILEMPSGLSKKPSA